MKSQIGLLVFLGLMISVLGLGACKRGKTSVTPLSDITGKWNGMFQGPAIQGIDFAFDLLQMGTKVTGRYSVPRYKVSGSIEGAFQDGALAISLKQQLPPDCPGSYTGSGRSEGQAVKLFISGMNCQGTLSNEQATMSR